MSQITFTVYRSDEYRQAYAVEHGSSCPDTIDVVVYVSDLPKQVRQLLCSSGKYPACVRWIYLSSDGKCCAAADSHLRCEHKSKLCFDCDESVTPAEIGRLVVDTFETLKADEESKQAEEAAKQAEEAAKQAELERARELMKREFDIVTNERDTARAEKVELRDELDSLYRLLDCIDRDTVHEAIEALASKDNDEATEALRHAYYQRAPSKYDNVFDTDVASQIEAK